MAQALVEKKCYSLSPGLLIFGIWDDSLRQCNTRKPYVSYGITVEESIEIDDKPFFLYLAYNAPHWPLEAKPEDLKKYEGKYKVGWHEISRRRLARQRAMGLIVMGKADVLRNGRGYVRTPSRALPRPSVIRLSHLIRRPRPRVKLVKKEIEKILVGTKGLADIAIWQEVDSGRFDSARFKQTHPELYQRYYLPYTYSTVNHK